jgi:ABC-type lipoprotein export system ATPase subunit
MESDIAPRLTNIEVTGLLGQFDHSIKFNPDDEFVIVHGPNGIGKTKLLELISNVFASSIGPLISLPFGEARFGFADDTLLIIQRQQQLALIEDDDEPQLIITLSIPGREVVTWRVDITHDIDISAMTMERQLRNMDIPIRRRGSRTWEHLPTGEVMRTEEVYFRYLASRNVRGGMRVTASRPEPMGEFLDRLQGHLIETQRLIGSRRWRGRASTAAEEGEPQSATVLQFSDDLKRRIASALADNSRTSQQLDRQFPGRLLRGIAAPSDATEENIRDRYNQQGEIRKKLTEISLLDTSYELPLPGRKLDDWERLVLWTYLDDTDQKLATFLPLLERVDLMSDIVNSRFLNKTLVIDRERGFRFKLPGAKELSAEQLSSGEQHELVLVYDLLFNAPPNSLVLIDEPEISLHASWQQEFLKDIIKIANVASLRFIIATHSPQIIHEWWSRTVQLTPRTI